MPVAASGPQSLHLWLGAQVRHTLQPQQAMTQPGICNRGFLHTIKQAVSLLELSMR